LSVFRTMTISPLRGTMNGANAVMRQCLQTVRAEVEARTFQAFELFACQGIPRRQWRKQLGSPRTPFFGAKRRVLRRARKLLAEMENDW